MSFALAKLNHLRAAARGRDCTIRVPDVCCFDPETVVACHVRLIGISGMGLKSPPFLIAFGCHRCHDVCDGRTKSEYTYEQRRLMLLEGMARTQVILYNEGKLSE